MNILTYYCPIGNKKSVGKLFARESHNLDGSFRAGLCQNSDSRITLSLDFLWTFHLSWPRLEDFREIPRDRFDYPDTICRHPDERDPEPERVQTVVPSS
jgi:hypothetical protein